MVYLIFDDMNQCSEQEVARLLPFASPQRREQAMRYQHIFGQFCCLKSYVMLCELLTEWGRINQQKVPCKPEFLYNEYGAPYIEGCLHFSISHCKHGIAVVINETPVGIDIETVRPFNDELVRKTMNIDEQQYINSSEKPDYEFVRLWTRKEAYLKLLGTGIVDDLHHTLDDACCIDWIELSDERANYICTIAQHATIS